MAATSLWKVSGRLDHVLKYAGNEKKTANPVFNESELQGLRDVMDYTYRDYKTEKQHYISGINCSPETARQEMVDTKLQYNKTGGIIAFHGYQSFEEGEVTPELAHEIGIKLAGEMWGDRFEVVVATHLDKTHIHNHLAPTSVPFTDGYNYSSTYENSDRFRIKSDRICEEYNLSVIYEPKHGRLPNPEVYKSEQWGGESYRAEIRAAVDKAISESLSQKDFFARLKKMGYEIKDGKDITVRAQDRKYGLKLFRNFGDDYTKQAINERILTHGTPQKTLTLPEPIPSKQRQTKPIRFTGNIRTTRKIIGFRALYIRYVYLLSGKSHWQIQGQRPLSARQVHFIFRDDIRKMQELKKEMELLGRNRIDSSEQLFSYRKGSEDQIAELTEKRQGLRYKSRRIKDETIKSTVISEIAGISAELRILRREVKVCDRIIVRTAEMKERIREVSEVQANEQKSKTKEVSNRQKHLQY